MLGLGILNGRSVRLPQRIGSACTPRGAGPL